MKINAKTLPKLYLAMYLVDRYQSKPQMSFPDEVEVPEEWRRRCHVADSVLKALTTHETFAFTQGGPEETSYLVHRMPALDTAEAVLNEFCEVWRWELKKK